MSIDPLDLTGELIVTEDGSVVVGRQELGSAIYEWCNGRLDNVWIKLIDISDLDEGDEL